MPRPRPRLVRHNIGSVILGVLLMSGIIAVFNDLVPEPSGLDEDHVRLVRALPCCY